jgi:hypothetical protein
MSIKAFKALWLLDHRTNHLIAERIRMKDKFYEIDSYVVNKYEQYLIGRHFGYPTDVDLKTIEGYTEGLYAFDYMCKRMDQLAEKVNNLKTAMYELGIIDIPNRTPIWY